MDTLNRLGCLAFTCGGASDVPPGSVDLVRGRHLIAIGDNDEPGEQCLQRKIKLAAGASTRVEAIRFPELPAGGDVSDWVEREGGTAAALLALARPANSEPPPGAAKPGKGDDEPRRISFQGVLVPVERDRLEIAPTLEPAAPFPVEFLPDVVRGAVEALHEHVQAPLGLCAHVVLSGATLAAQALADIKVPALPEAVPIASFFLAVAASGERKTALDRIVLLPVGQQEAELAKGYDEAMRRHKHERAIYESEHKKVVANRKLSADEKRLILETLPEPEEPAPPFMRVKEPTFEGIINLLKRSSSIGLFTSEGGQFLGGHGMTDEARIRTMTGLSELWDAGSAQRVRATEITRVAGRRLSISLAVQAKIAHAFLGNDAAKDQGFLARFLVMMPESTIGERTVRASEPLDDPRIRDFHRRLRTLLAQPRPLSQGSIHELSPPALALSEGAWSAWRVFAQAIEVRCRRETGDLEPVVAAALKMPENVARIAGVLALIVDPLAAQVDENAMAGAIEVGTYYLGEAMRLCRSEVADPETAAVDRLARWLTEKWPGPTISPNLIQQRAPANLRGNAETTQKRVRALCGAGVLSHVGKGQIEGKGYREVYAIARDGGPA